MTEDVTEQDVHAAALQYVRKIAGMRAPSAANTEAFEAAVRAVAGSTQELLEALVLRPVRPSSPGSPPPSAARPSPR